MLQQIITIQATAAQLQLSCRASQHVGRLDIYGNSKGQHTSHGSTQGGEALEYEVGFGQEIVHEEGFR